MWARLAEARLRQISRQFPAVVILGARQVGKTTLARRVFPQHTYCDLEEPGTRARFVHDPTFEIESRATPDLILDEAHAVPDVFASLRGIIDQRLRRGRFVLLGSSQPSLVLGVSESLAGRVGVVDLDPLVAAETLAGTPRVAPERLWLKGGFPLALRARNSDWMESYLRTVIERDLPQLGIDANPLRLRRLLTMLAHIQGGLLNLSQLGNALDVSYHSVARYLDLLEGAFLIRRLPPYFRNVGKRLTKSPKVYIRDTGVLHHLLGISTMRELMAHPGRGSSWETFVLEDLIRRERLANPGSQFSFWRTATGREVDLLIARGSRRFAIEIKSAPRRTPREIEGLSRSAVDAGVASPVWIVDAGGPPERLALGVERRGFSHSVDWLPRVVRSGGRTRRPT